MAALWLLNVQYPAGQMESIQLTSDCVLVGNGYCHVYILNR